MPGRPGHNKAPWTIRQDHPGGTDPSTGPATKPNTTSVPNPEDPFDRPPIPAELLETVARALAAALIPLPRQPEPAAAQEPDFLTAAQLAARLGVSRETVRRLAIAGALPHTVVCRGTRKTTRRFPRRFADEFAASGLDADGLAGFATAWRARVTAPPR